MSLDPLAILAILVGLQAKHFLFDFVFQSDWQVRHKGTYGHPGGLVHAGLHGLGSLVVFSIAATFGVLPFALAGTLAIADAVIHYHVDWTKALISSRKQLMPSQLGFWIAMGGDQAAHQLTYIALLAAAFLALA